jgi:two-component system, cell cycle sensor histidine kinase and response regulator CckA
MRQTATPTCTVLIGSGERATRSLLAGLLHDHGYQTHEVGDGPAALKLLDQASPDAVLVDVELPGPGGLEILRRVRRSPRPVPVLLMADATSTPAAADAARWGADGLLTRPLRPAEVLFALQRACPCPSLVPTPEGHEVEARLRHLQQQALLGCMTGGLAHDLRNLCTAQKIFGGVLIEGLRPDDPLRATAEEIRRTSELAGALLGQMIQMSRPAAAQPQVLDINAIIRDMDRLLRALLRPDIRFTTVLDPALGRTAGEASGLQQVVMNLVLNARDALPPDGCLTLTTGNCMIGPREAGNGPVPPGSYVTLAVTDTGCGMDAATRARLFEPFFTTKGAGGGTGLGLTIVSRIVGQWGGTIRVESEPGSGTTFTVYFPRTEATTEEGMETESAGDPTGGAETVLVVEDNTMIRNLVSRILGGQGYAVLVAKNGGEALQVSRGHSGPIHLLLTDMVMPDMNGEQLADQLGPCWPDMKVLYMSGYSSEDPASGRTSREGLFLEKPFTLDLLTDTVRRALDG